MSRTILVTGGAGYVGSHACKALARAGYHPVVIDNLSRGHEAAVKWGPLVTGDLAAPGVLDAVFARYKPSAVLHFAALAYVGESVGDPSPYYRVNVAGSLALLEAMRAASCMRLVFSSTCAVYGIPTRSPITEDHPCNPINPYGHSKLTVEGMIRAFGAAYGLRAVALRYFNAAGADPEGEIGEDHDPEPHLIPRALAAARAGGDGIQIFGDDYPTADGTCIRDYIHVSDLADAHVAALRHLEQGGEGMALNLGTGRGYSVREVLATVRDVTGRGVEAALAPRRPGDPPVLVSDPGRANAILSWRPRHPELRDQIRHAWSWIQRRAAVALSNG